MTNRRKYADKLQAKVAIEAPRGEKTLAEPCSGYDLHLSLITNWKKQAREGLVDNCNGGGERRDAEQESEIKEFHASMGELARWRRFYCSKG